MKSNIQIKTEEEVDVYFEEFLEYLKKSERIREEYREKIREAYIFSKEYHRGQKRLSGPPFIIHPIEVSKIVFENGLGTHSIISAILHDTIEDTKATLAEIEKKFGSDIAKIVDYLTRIKLAHKTKEESKIENLRKILLITIKDIRVLVIKICDRLHNMRTVGAFNSEKAKKYANETLEIYVPLAQKVGLYNLKWELEDLCLKYTRKEDYQMIKEKIKLKKVQREKVLEDIIKIVKIRVCQKYKKEFSIYGRLKNFYSIYKKFKEKFKRFEDIYDLYAIRIVVETIEECYLMFGIIQEVFQTIPQRIKDFISNPKANGYQSIHTTIILENFNTPIEIQIRTKHMHNLAEFGVAAHYRYKKIENDGTFDKKISWLREIFEFEKEHKDDLNINFLNILRSDFFEDEIFVFTPKQKVITLPENSIALDFAYSVHTDIGNSAHKAKINGEVKTLDTILKNGDIVNILTKKNSTALSRYLPYLKTAKAKLKLRQKLNLKKSSSQEKDVLFIYYNNKKLLEYIKDIDKYKKRRFSSCCKVEKDDSITGVIQKNELIVHNSYCSNLNNFEEKNKVKLRWYKINEEKVTLEIILEDRDGVLREFLGLLNNLNIKINGIKKTKKNLNIKIDTIKDKNFDIYLRKIKNFEDLLKLDIKKDF